MFPITAEVQYKVCTDGSACPICPTESVRQEFRPVKITSASHCTATRRNRPPSISLDLSTSGERLKYLMVSTQVGRYRACSSARMKIFQPFHIHRASTLRKRRGCKTRSAEVLPHSRDTLVGLTIAFPIAADTCNG